MSEGAVDFMRLMGLLVSTPVVFVSARPFFEAAWREARALAPGMDVPVALAIGGAYLVSLYATFAGTGEVYFDSVCMFTFFLSVGRYLEMRIRHRSASLTRSLIDSAPLIARREEEGGERVIPAQALVVGDRFRVRPGEALPADGRVVEGRSSVEEALLTGEPWPRSVGVGNAVIAGSVNVESPILVEATRVGDATTLASIVALIERAQSERPPIAQLADRVARVFVMVVLGIACLDFVVWQLLAPEQAIWTTLAVLVATCPCALSLATPTAIAAATHALARAGLLITRGRALEGLARADWFVFDKTGTLTSGQPALVRIVPLRGCDADTALSRARSLEADSEHPVARALMRSAPDPQWPSPRRATDVQAQPGFGVEGRVDGVRHRIGRPEWAAALAPSSPATEPGSAPPDEHEGLVWVMLADESGPLAWFGLDDPIRADAAPALARLRDAGRALEMLSGDPSPAAARVADRLGLEVACVAATPVGKVERVRALQRQGHRVVVVGDGVNDGPFLQAGDVSIAMGSGCDLSRLGADAVLIRDDLSLLPRAVECAQRVRQIMFQNFGWAFVYNLLVLPLAVTGHLAPWLAALGMSASSLVVVLNALRLNRLPEAS
jgi:Cu2+-exporting ATPase